MIPLLIALGVGALIVNEFSDKKVATKRRRRLNSTERQRKVFISFPVEDMRYRDFLVSQAKNKRSPFSFIDMSVKEPWTHQVWKRRCREKIKQCDGMIVLLSRNSWHSGGSRWEIRCAREEGIPVIGMHIKKDDKGAIPPELQGRKIIEWNWYNLERAIKSMR